MVDLARPWVLLLIPLVMVLEWRRIRIRTPSATELLPASSMGLMSSGALWVVRIAPTLRPGALVVLALALAGPGAPQPFPANLRTGPAIVAAVDVSGSMSTADMSGQPRLRVAKEELRRFVEGLSGFQVGLVSFSGDAVTQVPVTDRHRYLTKVLDGLEGTDTDGGTALGEAVGVGANRLLNGDGGSRILLLLTDGANNAGAVDPLSAARAAGDMGVRVFTVGVGSDSWDSGPEASLLSEMAMVSGGRFYQAGDREGLERVLQDIRRAEEATWTAGSFAIRPHHGGLLLMAALLLGGEGLARLSRLERLE